MTKLLGSAPRRLGRGPVWSTRSRSSPAGSRASIGRSTPPRGAIRSTGVNSRLQRPALCAPSPDAPFAAAETRGGGSTFHSGAVSQIPSPVGADHHERPRPRFSTHSPASSHSPAGTRGGPAPNGWGTGSRQPWPGPAKGNPPSPRSVGGIGPQVRWAPNQLLTASSSRAAQRWTASPLFAPADDPVLL